MFFGEVKEVFAIVDKTSKLEISSDDHALLTLRMNDENLVQINFDLVARVPSCKMEVTAEKEKVRLYGIELDIKFKHLI